MTDDNFLFAIAHVLRHEGGYKPADGIDRGGETNFGLTKRRYPKLDIARLTRGDAVTIYLRDYWQAYGLHRLENRDVATKLLDMMVNLGEATAILCAQRAVNYLTPQHLELVEDGALGPKTVAAINRQRPQTLRHALRAYHAKRYIELVEGPDPRFETFAEGWLIRAMA